MRRSMYDYMAATNNVRFPSGPFATLWSRLGIPIWKVLYIPLAQNPTYNSRSYKYGSVKNFFVTTMCLQCFRSLVRDNTTSAFWMPTWFGFRVMLVNKPLYSTRTWGYCRLSPILWYRASLAWLLCTTRNYNNSLNMAPWFNHL